jgi:hypothetical protein
MSPNYKKSLGLTNLFNQAIKQADLSGDFYYGKYNLLASMQMSVFSDIKTFTANGGIEIKINESLQQKVQVNILQIILVIISLLSFLVYLFKKPKLLLYSIDLTSHKKYKRDGRVAEMYDYVYTNKIKNLEIMHTIVSVKTLQNFWIRKSPVIYLESVNYISSLFTKKINEKVLQEKVSKFNLSLDKNSSENNLSFTKSEIKFLQNLFIKYINKAQQIRVSTKIWRFIFSNFKLKKMWGIEDVRYIWEMLLGLDSSDVKSQIFQHGHYTKYHIGFLAGDFDKSEIIKSSEIIVWNKYWKEELLRLGSIWNEGEIVIGGEKESVKNFIEKNILNDGAKNKSRNILIPFETDAPKDEVKNCIDKFINEEHKVYFKLRRDWTREKSLKLYNLKDDVNLICIFDEKDILSSIDAIAGVYSTYLYDMMYLGVPVLYLDTSMDYGEAMIVNGLALKFNLEDDLRDKIDEYAKIKDNVKAFCANEKKLVNMLNSIYKNL